MALCLRSGLRSVVTFVDSNPRPEAFVVVGERPLSLRQPVTPLRGTENGVHCICADPGHSHGDTQHVLTIMSQLCLAHYCEIHGPQCVLCTQAVPEPCHTQSTHSVRVSPTSSPERGQDVLAPSPSDAPTSAFSSLATPSYGPNENVKEGNRRKVTGASGADVPETRSVKGKSTLQASGEPSSASKSSQPSGSTAGKAAAGQSTRGSAGFQALGGVQQSDGNACASCSFTVPQSLSKQLPEGAPGSPNKQGGKSNSSPVLRTRAPLKGRRGSGQEGNGSESSGEDVKQPEKGQSSSRASKMSSTPRQIPPHARGVETVKRSGTKSPPHVVTYLTMHHPQLSEDYTTLRHSIIRTLSLETLPRGSSSGPLVFTSPQTGHTIAFIFRIPDPHARGHRRTYALIALSPTKTSQTRSSAASPLVLENLSLSDPGSTAPSGSAISSITTAFAQVASWITSLAELAADKRKREIEESSQRSAQESSALSSPSATRAGSGSGDLKVTPASSFLSAKRVDPDGHPRGGTSAREVTNAKSLAEICGREGLFVEVHVRFVKLLGGLMRSRTS